MNNDWLLDIICFYVSEAGVEINSYDIELHNYDLLTGRKIVFFFFGTTTVVGLSLPWPNSGIGFQWLIDWLPILGYSALRMGARNIRGLNLWREWD